MQQKLRKVEAENERLRSQLATSNLRKVAMKERVKEVECQTEKLRQRVEDADVNLLQGVLENSDNFDQKMSTNYFDVIIASIPAITQCKACHLPLLKRSGHLHTSGAVAHVAHGTVVKLVEEGLCLILETIFSISNSVFW